MKQQDRVEQRDAVHDEKRKRSAIRLVVFSSSDRIYRIGIEGCQDVTRSSVDHIDFLHCCFRTTRDTE